MQRPDPLLFKLSVLLIKQLAPAERSFRNITYTRDAGVVCKEWGVLLCTFWSRRRLSPWSPSPQEQAAPLILPHSHLKQKRAQEIHMKNHVTAFFWNVLTDTLNTSLTSADFIFIVSICAIIMNIHVVSVFCESFYHLLLRSAVSSYRTLISPQKSRYHSPHNTTVTWKTPRVLLHSLIWFNGYQ